MAKIFQSLLNRLNRVFNKDPRAVTAFQIKPPVQAKMVIADRQLTITAVGAQQPILAVSLADPYDAARTISIKALYEQIAAVPGFVVQSLNPAISPLGCIALIEGEYDLSTTEYGNVRIATALLWAIYRPLANALEQAKDDIDVAIQQLSFVTAQGDFLDYWGEVFGIPRYSKEEVVTHPDGSQKVLRTVEGDYEYSLRLLWETVKPRLNNKAIEEIIKRGTGYDTTIVDLSSKMLLADGYSNPTDKDAKSAFADETMVTDGHINNPNAGFPEDEARYQLGERYNFGQFGVYIEQPINSPYYQYTTSQLEEMVERHRAGGTTPWFIITQIAKEATDLVSKVVYDLEGAINQELSEDRVLMFGHGDNQFYTDHWKDSNVTVMPWHQENLEKPSLTDNVVMQTQQVQVPAETISETEGVFTQGALADGFLGGMNRNVARTDSTDTTDDVQGVQHITHEFVIGDSKTDYVFSPVVLNYKRVTDDFVSPHVEEGFSEDVLTVDAQDATGAINAFAGAGALTNVGPSGEVVITTPLRITAPVGITGLKIDELALTLQNLKDLPTIVRNLEIPYFGEHWDETYNQTRRFVIPFQDSKGNRFYKMIEWAANSVPPATALRISNPTADITADHVQIVTGTGVTITWNVTQAQSATLIRTRLSDGSQVSSSPVTYAGAITYSAGSALTEDTTFTIQALGNNNQIASHSVTVRLVAAPSVAVAPVITAKATPDVVDICSNSKTTVSYSVDFQSKQTENQTKLFPQNEASMTLTPLGTDPAGTIILDTRVITVSDAVSGAPVEGGFVGFGTNTVTFTPLDPQPVWGRNLLFNYDVNYGGSTLAFNYTNIELPDQGEVFQVAQEAVVNVPPPAMLSPTTLAPARNLLPNSEPAYNQLALTTANNAAGTVSGFSNAIKFNTFSQAALLYQYTPGAVYTMSCYYQSEEGSNPMPAPLCPGTATTNDFGFTMFGITALDTTSPVTVTRVTPGTNLAPYGADFEGGVLNGFGARGTVTCTVSSAQAHSGTFAAKVDFGASYTVGWGLSSVTGIPVLPNTTYTFSAWVLDNGTGTQPYLQYFERDQNNVGGTAGTTSQTAAATWTRLTQTFTTSASCRFVILTVCGNAANCSYFVDDVQLELGNTATPFQPSVAAVYRCSQTRTAPSSTTLEFFGNGGFENNGQYWSTGAQIAFPTDGLQQGNTGTTYCQLTTSAQAQCYARNVATNGTIFPVEPGDVLNFSGWIWSVSGDAGGRLTVAKLDANQASPTYSAPLLAPVQNGGWVYYTGSVTIPAGIYYVNIYCEIVNATQASVARFDNLSCKVTRAPYFGVKSTSGNRSLKAQFSGFQLEKASSVSAYEITPRQSGGIAPATYYTVNYDVQATNYAAKSERLVPVFVRAIQESGSVFTVDTVNPTYITEAIGDLVNETEPITLTGQGFSSKMRVFLKQKVDNKYQLVEAPITSLDWTNNTLTFIAPRFLAGNYPIRVEKLNCLGEVVKADETKVLEYRKHPTFYNPPIINQVMPPTVCANANYLAHNLLPYSNNFALWTLNHGNNGSNPTFVASDVLAPDGTNTAFRYVLNLNGNTTLNDFSSIETTSTTPDYIGQQFIFVVWLKTADGSTKQIRIEAASGSGTTVTVNGTWTRYSSTYTAPNTTPNTVGGFIKLRGTQGTSDSADICVWGAQTVFGNQVLTFYPTNGQKQLTPIGTSVLLSGANFRTGAVANVWTSTGMVAKTTKVLSDSTLKFTMDEQTLQAYKITVVNTDTSAGSTNGTPLNLISPSTPLTIDSFGYTAPKSASGCAFYGTNGFVLHWQCTNASYVSFTCADARVQAALTSPDPLGFPAHVPGSITIPVYTPGTQITIHAVNECGTTAQQTLTITEVECERTTSIEIIPDPIILKDRTALKVHCFQNTVKDTTGEKFRYDITDDVNLSYVVVENPDNCVSLNGKVVMGVLNNVAKIQASWKGFVDSANIVVQLPEPIALTATPNPIVFNNIGETFQLKVVATYSDGSEKVVTDKAIYGRYDSALISVNANGYITVKSLESSTSITPTTFIECAYRDSSVNPAKVVTDTVKVGKQDACLSFQRVYTEPAYAVAGNLDTLPINFGITGVNPLTKTVMADGTGAASLTYTGTQGGTDTVTATYNGIPSNLAKVVWVNPAYPLCSTPVTIDVYTGHTTGVFDMTGVSYAFTKSYRGLNFNDNSKPYVTTKSRPVQACIFDANNHYLLNGSVDNMPTSSVAMGTGYLQQFNAIITGKFIVKVAGNYTFTISNDDGYVFGIKGATRVSGDWYGSVPAATTKGYTVMGAYNTLTQPRTGSVVVNFPAPGIYDYEIDWCDGSMSEAQMVVRCNGVDLPFYDLPAVDAATTPTGQLTVTPTSIGPLVVGQTCTINSLLTGIDKRGTVKLIATANNIRTATLNGTSIRNGTLLPVWDYSLTEKLVASKLYTLNISNYSGQITAKVAANVLNFGTPTINKFAVYDASTTASPENSTALTVSYAAPVGVLWNCSNAVRVTLSDGTNTYELAGAGSRYVTPFSDRNYTLTAYAADGSTVTKTIAVTVKNYQHYTHDWRVGKWWQTGYYKLNPNFWFAASTKDTVQLGQTATVSLPAWADEIPLLWWNGYYYPFEGAAYYAAYDDWATKRITKLMSVSDVGFSKDGNRPTVQDVQTHYDNNVSQADSLLVAPTTNTCYNFILNGTWMWWFYDDWSYERVGQYQYSSYTWKLPYKRYWTRDWAWGFHTTVNVDPGPQITGSASASRVNAGDPVTITYESIFANTVTMNVTGSKRLPLGKVSFTVYPDKTTDFVITATSPSGSSTSATVHVDVTPQVLHAPCAALPTPVVNYIAVDGRKATDSLLSVDETETVHVLEIFGSHFIGDRAVTPEITGQVQVLVRNTSETQSLSVSDISVSNDYIRCKVRVHPYSVAGTYYVAVMNDVGVSTERGATQLMNVKVTIPRLLMNKPITAHSGDTVELYVDYVDSVRDTGLAVTVGSTVVKPTFVGANLTNEMLVTRFYKEILGRDPSMSELSAWVVAIENGMSRYEAMQGFLNSPEYKNSGKDVSVKIGTPVRVPVASASAVGVGIKTDNGISDVQVQFVPVTEPPAPVIPTNTDPVITGVTPQLSYAGNTVTIYGKNFTAGCTVYVGNSLVTSSYVNSTTMTFVVPTVAASVTTAVTVRLNSAVSSFNGFTIAVLAPVVDNPLDGGEWIMPPLNSGRPSTLTRTGYAYQQVTVTAPVSTASITTTQINNTTVTNTKTSTIDYIEYSDVSPLLRSTL